MEDIINDGYDENLGIDHYTYVLILKNVSADDPLTQDEIKDLKKFRASISPDEWQSWLKFARKRRKKLANNSNAFAATTNKKKSKRVVSEQDQHSPPTKNDNYFESNGYDNGLELGPPPPYPFEEEQTQQNFNDNIYQDNHHSNAPSIDQNQQYLPGDDKNNEFIDYNLDNSSNDPYANNYSTNEDEQYETADGYDNNYYENADEMQPPPEDDEYYADDFNYEDQDYELTNNDDVDNHEADDNYHDHPDKIYPDTDVGNSEVDQNGSTDEIDITALEISRNRDDSDFYSEYDQHPTDYHPTDYHPTDYQQTPPDDDQARDYDDDTNYHNHSDGYDGNDHNHHTHHTHMGVEDSQHEHYEDDSQQLDDSHQLRADNTIFNSDSKTSIGSPHRPAVILRQSAKKPARNESIFHLTNPFPLLRPPSAADQPQSAEHTEQTNESMQLSESRHLNDSMVTRNLDNKTHYDALSNSQLQLQHHPQQHQQVPVTTSQNKKSHESVGVSLSIQRLGRPRRPAPTTPPTVQPSDEDRTHRPIARSTSPSNLKHSIPRNSPARESRTTPEKPSASRGSKQSPLSPTSAGRRAPPPGDRHMSRNLDFPKTRDSEPTSLQTTMRKEHGNNNALKSAQSFKQLEDPIFDDASSFSFWENSFATGQSVRPSDQPARDGVGRQIFFPSTPPRSLSPRQIRQNASPSNQSQTTNLPKTSTETPKHQLQPFSFSSENKKPPPKRVPLMDNNQKQPTKSIDTIQQLQHQPQLQHENQYQQQPQMSNSQRKPQVQLQQNVEEQSKPNIQTSKISNTPQQTTSTSRVPIQVPEDYKLIAQDSLSTTSGTTSAPAEREREDKLSEKDKLIQRQQLELQRMQRRLAQLQLQQKRRKPSPERKNSTKVNKPTATSTSKSSSQSEDQLQLQESVTKTEIPTTHTNSHKVVEEKANVEVEVDASNGLLKSAKELVEVSEFRMNSATHAIEYLLKAWQLLQQQQLQQPPAQHLTTSSSNTQNSRVQNSSHHTTVENSINSDQTTSSHYPQQNSGNISNNISSSNVSSSKGRGSDRTQVELKDPSELINTATLKKIEDLFQDTTSREILQGIVETLQRTRKTINTVQELQTHSFLLQEIFAQQPDSQTARGTSEVKENTNRPAEQNRTGDLLSSSYQDHYDNIHTNVNNNNVNNNNVNNSNVNNNHSIHHNTHNNSANNHSSYSSNSNPNLSQVPHGLSNEIAPSYNSNNPTSRNSSRRPSANIQEQYPSYNPQNQSYPDVIQQDPQVQAQVQRQASNIYQQQFQYDRQEPDETDEWKDNSYPEVQRQLQPTEYSNPLKLTLQPPRASSAARRRPPADQPVQPDEYPSNHRNASNNYEFASFSEDQQGRHRNHYPDIQQGVMDDWDQEQEFMDLQSPGTVRTNRTNSSNGTHYIRSKLRDLGSSGRYSPAVKYIPSPRPDTHRWSQSLPASPGPLTTSTMHPHNHAFNNAQMNASQEFTHEQPDRPGMSVATPSHTSLSAGPAGPNIVRLCIVRGAAVKAGEDFPIRVELAGHCVDVVWREKRSGGGNSKNPSNKVYLHTSKALQQQQLQQSGSYFNSNTVEQDNYSVYYVNTNPAQHSFGAGQSRTHPSGLGSLPNMVLRRERFSFDEVIAGPQATKRMAALVQQYVRHALLREVNFTMLATSCGQLTSRELVELEPSLSLAVGRAGGTGAISHLLDELFRHLAGQSGQLHPGPAEDLLDSGSVSSAGRSVLRSSSQSGFRAAGLVQSRRFSKLQLSMVLVKGRTVVDLLAASSAGGIGQLTPQTKPKIEILQSKGSATSTKQQRTAGQLQTVGRLSQVTWIDLQHRFDFDRIIGLVLGQRSRLYENSTRQFIESCLNPGFSNRSKLNLSRLQLEQYLCLATWTASYQTLQSLQPATDGQQPLSDEFDDEVLEPPAVAADEFHAHQKSANSFLDGDATGLLISFALTPSLAVQRRNPLLEKQHFRVLCPVGPYWANPGFDLNCLSEALSCLPYDPPKSLHEHSPLTALLTDDVTRQGIFLSLLGVDREQDQKLQPAQQQATPRRPATPLNIRGSGLPSSLKNDPLAGQAAAVDWEIAQRALNTLRIASLPK